MESRYDLSYSSLQAGILAGNSEGGAFKDVDTRSYENPSRLCRVYRLERS